MLLSSLSRNIKRLNTSSDTPGSKSEAAMFKLNRLRAKVARSVGGVQVWCGAVLRHSMTPPRTLQYRLKYHSSLSRIWLRIWHWKEMSFSHREYALIHPQLQSRLFAAPNEIRDAIYRHLIPNCIHLFLRNGEVQASECVRRKGDEVANCFSRRTKSDNLSRDRQTSNFFAVFVVLGDTLAMQGKWL